MIFSTCDRRLSERANFCFEKVQAFPGQHFPNVFKSGSELAGFYRFINNQRVTDQTLLSSITSRTIESASSDSSPTLCIHDTSQMTGACLELKKGLKFFSHNSLAVNFGEKPVIHGLVAIKNWQGKTNSQNHERWYEKAIEPNEKLVNCVHVMDREADSYIVFSQLSENNCDWIIRLQHNRQTRGKKIFDLVKKAPVVAKRLATVSKRTGSVMPYARKKHPPRETRQVELAVQYVEVETSIPKEAALKWQNYELPQKLKMTVVRVYELNPPKGEKPVEWFLGTNLPVTKDTAVEVVDMYRRCWVIEEYFKGLKSGCKLEERQFGSIESLSKLTVFFSEIATKLMNLRYLSHLKIDCKAILSPSEWKVLEILATKNKTKLITLEDATAQLAKLGGHIKSNGPPGWVVLARGYNQLQAMAQGVSLFQEMC